MPDHESHLARAVECINDGREVDWAELDALAADESFRARVDALRVMASVASFARTAGDGPASGLAEERPTVTWGHLKVLERIGSGRFGEVYRAWDSRLGRQVALKLISGELDHHEGRVSSVIEEAHLLGRVRHPNVVTIYGADLLDGRVGLWMELVSGRSLQELVSADGPLQPEAVLEIGRSLAGTLAAVHEAGVLHRDLKASNVMQDTEGRIVLTDFGAGLDRASPDTETVAGTPFYLAPEVINGEPPTDRSDLYSLGVLLFYLASGTYPVPGRTLGEIRETHGAGRVPSARAIRPSLTEPLVVAIDRLLMTDPAARFANARELLQALDPAVSPGRSWTPIRAAVVAGAVVALIATLGALGARSRNRHLTEVHLLTDPGGWGPTTADGRLMACMPQRALAVCDLESGVVTPLPHASDNSGTPGAIKAISPDGTTIAFQWVLNREPGRPATERASQLRVIDVAGNAPARILQASDSKGFPAVAPDAWSSDSNRIVARVQYGPDDWGIVLIDPATLSMDRVESATLPLIQSRVSPDGRFLSYSMIIDGASDIYVRHLHEHRLSKLVAHPANDQGAIWRRDGRAVAFASQRGGTWDLWELPLDQGQPAGEPVRLSSTGRSRLVRPLSYTSGDSLIYWAEAGGMDVYRAPVDPQIGAIGEAVRIAANPLVVSASPDWSPDGQRLAYAAETVGRAAGSRFSVVVQHLLSGTFRDYPIGSAPHQTTVRWAADGKHLWVRASDPSGPGKPTTKILEIASGSLEPVSATMPGFFEWWSDTSAVVLTRDGLVEYDLQSGIRRTLRPTDGLSPDPQAWSLSPDRRQLARMRQLRSGEFEQVVEPLDGSESHVVMRTSRPCFAQGWWRIELFVSCWNSMSDRTSSLFLVSAAGGEPRAVGGKLEQIFQLRVSPDGTQVAFSAGLPHQEVWRIDNLRR